MIIRKKYINRITPYIDKPVIKVITGIRRCGKSTFMKQIIDFILEKDVKKHQIIYINKELFEFDFLKNYSDLHHYVSQKSKSKNLKYYLFIDEVHEIDDWEKAVNSFLAEDCYDVYISGSNARMLSSDLASLITGRYIEFKMYTLSFAEFKSIYEKKNNPDNKIDVFSEFIKYGGFPGLHNLEWEENILRQYLEAIYNTVFLKDVLLKNQIKDVSMLSHTMDFITANCGNITSAKSIRDFSKSQGRTTSTDTILNYLAYAMDALLIHKVKRFDLQGKRILETYEKYYLADTGLALNSIGNAPETLPGKLENIVFLELLTAGYQVNIGKNKDLEIDFIATKNNDKIYIQVCTTLQSEKTIEREYAALKGIKDSFSKYVISMDHSGFTTNDDGVKWMNIQDFLLSLYEDKVR